MTKQLLFFILLLSLTPRIGAQDTVPALQRPTALERFLTPADTFNKKRFFISAGAAAGLYGAFSVGLWQAWYKETSLSRFHFFNDWHEWQQVDKAGHAYTAYNYSRWAFQGARWTGMRRHRAAWAAAGVGMLLQSTTEVMDGFAAKWGFSWGDMSFNVLGCALFAGQELTWGEQRITMKVSSDPVPIPEMRLDGVGHPGFTTVARRREELFGRTYAERFIKDYNAQVNWLSFNIKSLAPHTRIPPWLNISLGYGAANMLAGEGYEWTGKDGLRYRVDPLVLPRYRRFFLSTDIELTKLPIKNRVIKTLLYGIHHFKFPGPALEVNSLGKVRFHALFW